MKDLTKKIWKPGLIMLLLSAPVLVACDDDDDNDRGRFDPAITQIATNRYPGAQVVEVEREAQGYEIQMRYNGGEVDMHITPDYQWLYTEFDDMPYASLPAPVATAFEATGYTFNLYEDDVDRIEYPDANGTAEYYRIELDREPTDIILSYNPDGSQRQ